MTSEEASTEDSEVESGITIWIDADACPVAVKELIYRTANRRKISAVLIANAGMRVPNSKYIRSMIVPHGANIADDKIVELMKANDLVITADIPLAARVVEKGGFAIGPRGQLFDDDKIHSRLATRDLMEQMRSAGVETSGPKPLSQKDVGAFANQLDRMLTKLLK